jgi:hypothetical protein
MRLTTVGLLPPAIRVGHGFSWGSRKETMLRRWAGLVQRLLPLTPPMLRYWPAARAASPGGGPVRLPDPFVFEAAVPDAPGAVVCTARNAECDAVSQTYWVDLR